MQELDIVQRSTVIAQDNVGAIELASTGPAKHFTRRKHIDVKPNKVVKCMHERDIELGKVDTKDISANFLANALQTKEFVTPIHCNQIINIDD